jgi:hypothetical protein
MFPYHQRVLKYTFQVSTVIALGFLLNSCSESKFAECNRLIEVANQAVREVQGATQVVNTNATATNSPETLRQVTDAAKQVAASADKARAEMEALRLSDQQLRDFQARFIAMYGGASKATKDWLTAAGSQNTEAAQKANEDLRTVTAQEPALVQEVNNYCSN